MVARCRLFAYGLANVSVIPEAHNLLPQNGCTYLLLAYPGCTG